jgi:transcriptional regulator with XRE-family HTH domain
MPHGGEALREARVAADMTLREVAERIRAIGISCSHSYLQLIEVGGVAKPREDVLLAAADILGMSRSEVQALFRILPAASLEARHPDLYRIQRLLEGLPPSRRRKAVRAIETLLSVPTG